jgi:peptidoglycan/xylan/chitin deacetylase (PgdA/CDA1 family)
MQPKQQIALNINFDSLSECLRLSGVNVEPGSFVDPCFDAIVDRFRSLCEEYNAPLSIYVVGRDLLTPAHRKRVREWSDQGIEIGNHTWSHLQTLSNMSLDETRDEISKAHDLIGETTGRAPRGFIAPAWSTSKFVVQTLTELKYRYDTSLTPSWMQLVALLKLRLNSSASARVPLLRRDLPGLLWGSRDAYLATPARPWRPNATGLTTLPLPTGPYRVPVWHTMSFLMSPQRWDRLLRKGMAMNETFYYLMHPVDLLDPDTDLVGLPDAVRRIERITVPFSQKLALLRRSLDAMAERAEFVTMEQLAERAVIA